MNKETIGDNNAEWNIFRRVYSYIVLKMLCAILARENKRLRDEAEKLRTILLQKKEES